jgi:O-antigen ligase
MFGCLAALAVSAALGVGLPGYGLVPGGYEAGSLKGVMTDRNSLSFVLLIGLIATVSYEFRGRWARVYKCTLCLLFFAGVLWTRSSTCLVLSVLTVALAAELALLRTVVQAWRGWAIAGGAIATCIAGFYINSHFDQVLRLVERDATFSGRTAVWPAVKNLIAKDPWLGQGWGGVWGNEPVRQELARAIGFEVPHAHNGYLDVQLQVGEVGLILVFVVLFLIAVRGVLCFLRTNSSLSSWAIILMLVLLFYNRVETSFSAPFTMFLMFATLVTLDKLTCRSPLACANGESIF